MLELLQKKKQQLSSLPTSAKLQKDQRPTLERKKRRGEDASVCVSSAPQQHRSVAEPDRSSCSWSRVTLLSGSDPGGDAHVGTPTPQQCQAEDSSALIITPTPTPTPPRLASDYVFVSAALMSCLSLNTSINKNSSRQPLYYSSLIPIQRRCVALSLV